LGYDVLSVLRFQHRFITQPINLLRVFLHPSVDNSHVILRYRAISLEPFSNRREGVCVHFTKSPTVPMGCRVKPLLIVFLFVVDNNECSQCPSSIHRYFISNEPQQTFFSNFNSVHIVSDLNL